MRPRTTPESAYVDIAEVAHQRDKIPSNRDLASKHRISESYVRHLMKLARKGLLSAWDAASNKPRPRPQTAIISEAAQRAIETREWAEGSDDIPIAPDKNENG